MLEKNPVRQFIFKKVAVHASNYVRLFLRFYFCFKQINIELTHRLITCKY